MISGAENLRPRIMVERQSSHERESSILCLYVFGTCSGRKWARKLSTSSLVPQFLTHGRLLLNSSTPSREHTWSTGLGTEVDIERWFLMFAVWRCTPPPNIGADCWRNDAVLHPIGSRCVNRRISAFSAPVSALSLAYAKRAMCIKPVTIDLTSTSTHCQAPFCNPS